MSEPVPVPYRVPWPAAWGPQEPTRRSLVGLGAAGVLGVLLVALAVVALLGPDPVLAVPSLLGATAALSLGGLLWLTRVRVRDRGAGAVRVQDGDDRAVVVPDQRAVTVLELVLAGGLFLLLLGALVVAVAGAVDDLGVGAALLLVVCVLLPLVALRQTVRVIRRGTGRLDLTPTQLRRHVGPSLLVLPWDAVTGLRLDGRHRVTVLARDGRTVVLDGSRMHADPALVAATVDFYAQHPEHRAELGTQAAVERMRTAARGCCASG